MHLQQTKSGSRGSGGPQYYFHNIPAHVKDYLRKRKACPVVLQTPYGIAKSEFTAVDRDHKLTKTGKAVPGRVGHDRIQQAGGEQSIGEAIRYWYNIKKGRDFERIDVEVEIHEDGHFILVPVGVQLRSAVRPKVLEKISWPLSFHRDHQSKLWRQQIENRRKQAADDVMWAAAQISRVVADHGAGQSSILESDLFRVSGALSILGMELSAYLGKGYDCLESSFQFGQMNLPRYPCPVEIKKRSSGFNYQVTKYTDLPRVVVLCMNHDLKNPPNHIDVIELSTFAEYLGAK
jgi:hypothetical protein